MGSSERTLFHPLPLLSTWQQPTFALFFLLLLCLCFAMCQKGGEAFCACMDTDTLLERKGRKEGRKEGRGVGRLQRGTLPSPHPLPSLCTIYRGSLNTVMTKEEREMGLATPTGGRGGQVGKPCSAVPVFLPFPFPPTPFHLLLFSLDSVCACPHPLSLSLSKPFPVLLPPPPLIFFFVVGSSSGASTWRKELLQARLSGTASFISPPLPNRQRRRAKWKLGRNAYTSHTRFRTFDTDS